MEDSGVWGEYMMMVMEMGNGNWGVFGWLERNCVATNAKGKVCFFNVLFLGFLFSGFFSGGLSSGKP